MLWEYRLPLREEQVARLEESGEAVAWSCFRDAREGRDYLIGYFETDEAAAGELARVEQVLGGSFTLGDTVRSAVEDRDWREAYKEHFRPWSCEGLHWVPVWDRGRYRMPAGDAVVWLDPGMAFGTGEHETTRLCLERMMAFRARIRERGESLEEYRVLDAGSGSGILAISAARLGFGRVSGFDDDAEAVAISRENATKNGLDGRVSFQVAGLPDGLRGQRADLLLANIQSDVLCRHAEDFVAATAPGGSLVLSGILALEADRVRDAFARVCSGASLESRTLGEWADLAIGF